MNGPMPMVDMNEANLSLTGGHTLPQNIDAEAAVLAAAILSGEVVPDVCASLSPEDFYRPSHRVVFGAIQELYRHDIPVDQVSLADYLEAAGQLSAVGGKPFIIDLASNSFALVNWRAHTKIVRRTAVLRRLIAASTGITALAFDAPPEDVESTIQRSEEMLFSVTGKALHHRPGQQLLRPGNLARPHQVRAAHRRAAQAHRSLYRHHGPGLRRPARGRGVHHPAFRGDALLGHRQGGREQDQAPVGVRGAGLCRDRADSPGGRPGGRRLHRLHRPGQGAAGHAPGLAQHVSTGFTDLDKVLLGMRPGSLNIVGARPGVGKTSFALSLALNAARAGASVLLFSLEMSGSEIATRLLCAEARVSNEDVRGGNITDDMWEPLARASEALSALDFTVDDTAGTNVLCAEARVSNEDVRGGNITDDMWEPLARASEALSALDFTVDDTAGTNVVEIRTKARRALHGKERGLVIVDYLQLINPVGRNKNDSVAAAIGEISRSLKVLAKDLSVPVIALSQLNREVEKRPDKRPMLADLRDSGSIEQDADTVMFIDRSLTEDEANDEKLNREVEKRPDKRPMLADLRDSGSIEQDADTVMFIDRSLTEDEANDEKHDRPPLGTANIIVAKNRAGRSGVDVPLAFIASRTAFTNLARTEG